MVEQKYYKTGLILTKLSTKGMEGRHGLSGVHVLAVSVVDLSLLQGGEVEEVRWSMDFVVELVWVGQLKVVLHVGVMAHTCTTKQVTFIYLWTNILIILFYIEHYCHCS